ncbi:T9SS type A sorting domain-containing protein [Yeosuana sp. AK3]
MKNFTFLFTLIPLFMFGQIQIGNDIEGKTANEFSGWSVSLAADGNTVAIGAPLNSDNGSIAGQVRIFENNSGTWSQIGSDINGEASGDRFGSSVSISSDGSIVAIGAINNDGNDTNSGHVRVYENITGVWTQIGSDIDGEAINDQLGTSVSISSDGTTVATGAPKNDGNGSDAGHVRVFKNILGVWTQIGSDVDGEAAFDQSGNSVSLSSDGNILAIGAKSNSGSASGSGHVRVYENITGVWTQIGSDIDGEAAFDQSGHSVALSSDGTVLAIGAPSNGGTGELAGHVRVYKNTAGVWTQIGNDINAEAANDFFGWSVSLSSNGLIVAIGAYLNDGNGSNSGHVRVYKNISSVWTQIGSDIDAEAAGDGLGYSVSLSPNTGVLAIGAFSNDGNGSGSGHVRVYDISAVLKTDSFKVELSRVYPNPASTEIHITLKNNLQLLNVNLYKQLGQFIKQSNTTTIDVSELTKGLYLVEIETNQGKGTKKVLLE